MRFNKNKKKMNFQNTYHNLIFHFTKELANLDTSDEFI